MTSKRLEQYNKLVGNFKAAREFGFKITGNAEFIAAARTLLPDIATAYLELQAAHDKLQQRVAELENIPREYDEYREEVRAMKKEEAGE